MHKYIFLLSVITVCAVSCGVIKDGLPETTIGKCINRKCIAETGDWDANLCSFRLMYLQRVYWENASTEENQKCILNIINSYTPQFGTMDCNLDKIPTEVFNGIPSCLEKKNSEGKYKRSIRYSNQNVNVDANQNINGNNIRAVQRVNVHVRGG